MAESLQTFEYTQHIEDDLTMTLTKPRLGRFLVKGGYRFPLVMEWYLWNARLVKSLQFPIHAMEVTLRNAVVDHMIRLGAPREWAFDKAYVAKLAARDSQVRIALNAGKLRLLRSKMSEPEYAACVEGREFHDIPHFDLLDTNDVIAKLSLEFWIGMLGQAHDADWHVTMKAVFPHAPTGTSRRDIWRIAFDIKEIRNRMAHHEPILHLPLEERHGDIVRLIGMRSKSTRNWVNHYSTFNSVLKDEPRSLPVPSGDTIDVVMRPAEIVSGVGTLLASLVESFSAGKSGSVVLIHNGEATLIVAGDILNWLATQTSVGIADLGETVGDLVSKVKLTHRAEIAGPGLSLSSAGARFYARNVPTRKKPTALMIFSNGLASGELLGVVLKEDVTRLRT